MAKNLDALVTRVGGKQTQNGAVVVKRSEVQVVYRFMTRGYEPWTMILAEIPPKYPLSIYVRRHVADDQRDIARDAMTDIKIGDQAFDDAFLIEAAPADVVRELLDAPLRELLTTLDSAELTTGHGPTLAFLCLAVRGHEDNAEIGEILINNLVRVAARVRDAYASADKTAERPQGGAPFRPEADGGAEREHHLAQLKEVLDVETKRTSRGATKRMVIMGLILVLMILGIVLRLAALSQRLR